MNSAHSDVDNGTAIIPDHLFVYLLIKVWSLETALCFMWCNVLLKIYINNFFQYLTQKYLTCHSKLVLKNM